MSPFASQIGFHPDFDLNELLNLAAIEVVEIKPVNLFGYWKLVRLRNVPVMVTASERSEVGAGYAEPPPYKLREGSSAAR
jgi:phosphatidylethanolamine/phosphatidyl-N-methylethanolamine N-methyltransferase